MSRLSLTPNHIGMLIVFHGQRKTVPVPVLILDISHDDANRIESRPQRSRDLEHFERIRSVAAIVGKRQDTVDVQSHRIVASQPEDNLGGGVRPEPGFSASSHIARNAAGRGRNGPGVAAMRVAKVHESLLRLFGP